MNELSEGQRVVDEIVTRATAVWALQQRGPDSIRLHPADMEHLLHDQPDLFDGEADPPTVDGHPLVVTDEVAEGAPEAA